MAAAQLLSRCSIRLIRGPSGSLLSRVSARITLPCSSILIKNNAIQGSVFHTSSQQNQIAVPMNRKQGAVHWIVERGVAVGLLALIPAGCFFPMPAVDWGLALLLPLHAYWGVNAIFADYMPVVLAPAAKITWLVMSVLGFCGLCYINVSDVGICKLVSSLMTL